MIRKKKSYNWMTRRISSNAQWGWYATSLNIGFWYILHIFPPAGRADPACSASRLSSLDSRPLPIFVQIKSVTFTYHIQLLFTINWRRRRKRRKKEAMKDLLSIICIRSDRHALNHEEQKSWVSIQAGRDRDIYVNHLLASLWSLITAIPGGLVWYVDMYAPLI